MFKDIKEKIDYIFSRTSILFSIAGFILLSNAKRSKVYIVLNMKVIMETPILFSRDRRRLDKKILFKKELLSYILGNIKMDIYCQEGKLNQNSI